MAHVHVGTSGYSYKHWKEIFYPGVPAARWLPRYAQLFATVELNATFYRLPSVQAVLRWREQVPPGFLFAAKGSRFLTHNKKLTDVEQGLERYFEPVQHLVPKLGALLWQLPPQLAKADLPRLERFLRALPRSYRHAVEFRSEAWYSHEVCDLLDRFGAAFCEHDLVARRPPRPTGGWRYLRFHGIKYTGRYGPAALRPFAEDLAAWRASGKSAFAYFNNDIGGHALYDAQTLRDFLYPDELPAASSMPLPA